MSERGENVKEFFNRYSMKIDFPFHLTHPNAATNELSSSTASFCLYYMGAICDVAT